VASSHVGREVERAASKQRQIITFRIDAGALNPAEDLRMIGAQLNAAYVVEGSVRKSGDQIRITAQLINTSTGAHEWSETYDEDMGDVLKVPGPNRDRAGACLASYRRR
jgi:TolB-like protein